MQKWKFENPSFSINGLVWIFVVCLFKWNSCVNQQYTELIYLWKNGHRTGQLFHWQRSEHFFYIDHTGHSCGKKGEAKLVMKLVLKMAGEWSTELTLTINKMVVNIRFTQISGCSRVQKAVHRWEFKQKAFSRYVTTSEFRHQMFCVLCCFANTLKALSLRNIGVNMTRYKHIFLQKVND